MGIEYLTQNKSFIRETNEVLGIMTGVTPGALLRRRTVSWLCRLLSPALFLIFWAYCWSAIVTTKGERTVVCNGFEVQKVEAANVFPFETIVEFTKQASVSNTGNSSKLFKYQHNCSSAHVWQETTYDDMVCTQQSLHNLNVLRHAKSVNYPLCDSHTYGRE